MEKALDLVEEDKKGYVLVQTLWDFMCLRPNNVFTQIDNPLYRRMLINDIVMMNVVLDTGEIIETSKVRKYVNLAFNVAIKNPDIIVQLVNLLLMEKSNIFGRLYISDPEDEEVYNAHDYFYNKIVSNLQDKCNCNSANLEKTSTLFVPILLQYILKIRDSLPNSTYP